MFLNNQWRAQKEKLIQISERGDWVPADAPQQQPFTAEWPMTLGGLKLAGSKRNKATAEGDARIQTH